MWTIQNQRENSTNLYSIDKTNEEYNAFLMLSGLLTISPAPYFDNLLGPIDESTILDEKPDFIKDMPDEWLEPYLVEDKQIGEGCCADVYEADWNVNGKQVDVVMKIIPNPESETFNMGKDITWQEEFYKQAIFHHWLGGEGFINLIAAYSTPTYWVLVFPKMEDVYERNLELANMQNRERSQEEVRQFMVRIISHIQALHERNICHGDIKLANILVDENENYFLCDFGKTKYEEPNEHEGKNLDLFELAKSICYFAATVDLYETGCLVLAREEGTVADYKKLIEYLPKLGYKKDFMDVISALMKGGIDLKEVLKMPFLTSKPVERTRKPMNQVRKRPFLTTSKPVCWKPNVL